MPRIIDLSYPIEDHFRWKVERDLAASFDEGAQFQITRFGLAVHGFTHIDAPRHMLPEGSTTSEFRLDDLVGEAAIVDLRGVAANEPITAAALERAGSHIRNRDMVILQTAWDRRFPLADTRFWTEAPYLTRDACEWLARFQPRAAGFDFPQDRPIRNLLKGDNAPISDFVSHDVLLRRGTLLIEYLCNLDLVRNERAYICALPLNLRGADGAPARVAAIVSGAPE